MQSLIQCWLFVCFVSLLTGQTPTPGPFEFKNAPAESVTSPVFDMSAEQWLRVDAVALGPDFDLDVFVYRADTKELVGMSDNDSNDTYFHWTAVQTGKYYVVLRNTSNSNGTSKITIMPKGSRGAVSGELAQAADVEVFYATDRKKMDIVNSIQTYGGTPSSDGHLEFGVAKVRIPRDHRMGELEGSTIYKLIFQKYNQETQVAIESEKPESSAEFFSDVRKASRDELFVFVHGFNVTFEDAVRRTAQIKYDLGFKGAAVLYSWPSNGGLLTGILSYNSDGQNAQASAPRLRQFLVDLSQKTGVKTIHLIAHSMGNRLAVSALANNTGTPLQIKHVALLAPDIDSRQFMLLAAAMKASASDVTLYASSRDLALQASEHLAQFPRAGEGGPKVIVIPGILQTIDASTVETSIGLMHSYYADNSTILSDLFQLLRGQRADDRFGLEKVKIAIGEYWVFKPSNR